MKKNAIFSLGVLVGSVSALVLQSPLSAQNYSRLERASRDGAYVCVKEATRQIQAAGGNATLYAIRGGCRYKITQFEGALADLNRGRGADKDQVLQVTGKTREKWLEELRQLMPLLPLVSKQGSRTNYRIAVRGVRGSLARQAARAFSDANRIARRLFGDGVDGITYVILPNRNFYKRVLGTEFSRYFQSLEDRPDAEAFAGNHFVVVFPELAQRDGRSVRSTMIHELLHVADLQSRLYKLKSKMPNWWIEGLAVYGEQLSNRKNDAAALRDWTAAYKRAGSIEKDLLLDNWEFQRNVALVGLHYATGNLMVRQLIRDKGEGVIASINRAIRNGSSFEAALRRVGGTSASQLFDTTIAWAKRGSGTDLSQRQYVPPDRDVQAGDLILARNTYAPDERYIPAYYARQDERGYRVRYSYGSDSYVRYGQFRHFDWRKGVKLYCRINEEYRPVTVILANRHGILIRYRGAQRKARLGDCYESGRDLRRNKRLPKASTQSNFNPSTTDFNTDNENSDTEEKPNPVVRPNPVQQPKPHPGRTNQSTTTELKEGMRVICNGKTGRVQRTIGKKALIFWDSGGTDILKMSKCRIK